ncbi:thioredoxin domain-containing protein [Oerskovia sp. M15]
MVPSTCPPWAARRPHPGTAGGAPVAGGYVVDVTEESFPQLVQDSTQYPVVVLLWIPTDQANAELGTELGTIAEEFAGRFLLGRVDAQTYPQIAAAFQVETVPTVVAIVGGQPVPLFQGPPRASRSVRSSSRCCRSPRGTASRAVPAQGIRTTRRLPTGSPRPHPSRSCRRCTRRRSTRSSATTSTRRSWRTRRPSSRTPGPPGCGRAGAGRPAPAHA